MTDLLRCDPEHSSQLPIDLNLHCRIVEFLFVREIPQRWDAAQSVLDLLGILARLGEIRTAHGDLDRRRRPEAHDPTDYVVALEAEAHIRQFLRQHLPQPLLKFADANSRVAFELDLENRFFGSAGPQINGVDRIGRGWDPDKAQGDLDVAWASLARNDVEGPICDPVGLLDARAGGRAKLCILAVFVSAFFMQGAARNLFIPLAFAVGFAMVASYILSTTLVPVLLVWVLRHRAQHLASTGPTSFDRFRNRYRNFAARVVARRWTVVLVYLGIVAGIIFVIGGNLGREIFPVVDAGQFALRLRAAPGTRIEETERIANRTLDIIAREAGPGNVEITLGFVGVQNAAYPINAIYLWTSGPEEAVLQVQLKGDSG